MNLEHPSRGIPWLGSGGAFSVLAVKMGIMAVEKPCVFQHVGFGGEKCGFGGWKKKKAGGIQPWLPLLSPPNKGIWTVFEDVHPNKSHCATSVRPDACKLCPAFDDVWARMHGDPFTIVRT